MLGNEKLNDIDRKEEAFGKNALFAGFQGQREWSDYKPNADFTWEAIMNSSFDWNMGKSSLDIPATESDNLNGLVHGAGKSADRKSAWICWMCAATGAPRRL